MWFVRARPVDYLLAMSEFYAALPLVGKHLEPIGGITAMGAWGYRHAPEFMSSAVAPGFGAATSASGDAPWSG